MEALQAVVLTSTQLHEMMTDAARKGAALAVEQLRSELHQTPDEATLQQLRVYLTNPATLANPNDYWAHSGLVRQIQLSPRGKPKSSAWFMLFQRESGLSQCFSRPSPGYGRRKEWRFTDIRLAWDTYYRKRRPNETPKNFDR